MRPEERELSQYEIQKSDLQEELVAQELALETAISEVESFRRRYYREVGVLFAELDRLEAELAERHLRQRPDDVQRQRRATEAAEQAARSGREAKLEDRTPAPRPAITEELKQAYRQAVKLFHPDLVLDSLEKARRTSLMSDLNAAYARGDLEAIKALIRKHQDDPSEVHGDDTGARIVRAIRTIAQLRARIAEIQSELDALQGTELYQLKLKAEAEEARGGDPLGNLARSLTAQILEKRTQLQSPST